MHGSLTTGSHLTHPNRKLSYSEPASDWRPLQRLARSTSQAPLFHSQPRSNSLVLLLTSLFHLTHTSRLYLNHVSITFAPFATFDQFLVKAPPISSPVLLSLPGWTMPMPVCLASQTRICLGYREFRTHLLGLLHSPDRGPAQPLFWNTSTGFQSQLGFTSKLRSWLLKLRSWLHAIAPLYLSSLVRPYVPSRALRSSSAHQLCVPHVSTVFGLLGFRSAGPTIWNSLLLSVTSCSTIHTFKKQLKTHLFTSAFPSSWIVLDAPLIRWSPFIYLFGCPWFCACLNVCYYY